MPILVENLGHSFWNNLLTKDRMQRKNQATSIFNTDKEKKEYKNPESTFHK